MCTNFKKYFDISELLLVITEVYCKTYYTLLLLIGKWLHIFRIQCNSYKLLIFYAGTVSYFMISYPLVFFSVGTF